MFRVLLQGRSVFRGVPKTQELSNIAATELRSVRRPGESQTSADLSDPATRQVAKKKRRSVRPLGLLRVNGQNGQYAGNSGIAKSSTKSPFEVRQGHDLQVKVAV